MKNFAKILIACGILFVGLSALLLGYNEPASAEYLMCLANIVLGFIMFVLGVIYLLVKNKHK
jgi:ABC-type uncharacterized transport system permease subunit